MIFNKFCVNVFFEICPSLVKPTYPPEVPEIDPPPDEPIEPEIPNPLPEIPPDEPVEIPPPDIPSVPEIPNPDIEKSYYLDRNIFNNNVKNVDS